MNVIRSVISSKTLLTLLTVCLLVAGVAVYAVAAKEDGAGAAEDGEAGTTQEEVAGATGEGAEGTEVPTQDTEAHAMLALDPADERQLVGESEHVFFGRVVEQVGSEPIRTQGTGRALPRTQFSVEVSEAIKGDASGTVTVNQAAGYEDDGHEDHKHRRVFEGDQLLVPGEEYLFYTNYEEDRGRHVLSVPVAASHVEIDSEEKRSKEREEAKEAKANQVKVDPEDTPPPADPNAGRPCLPDGSSGPGGRPCDPSAPPIPPKDKGSGKAK